MSSFSFPRRDFFWQFSPTRRQTTFSRASDKHFVPVRPLPLFEHRNALVVVAGLDPSVALYSSSGVIIMGPSVRYADSAFGSFVWHARRNGDHFAVVSPAVPAFFDANDPGSFRSLAWFYVRHRGYSLFWRKPE